MSKVISFKILKDQLPWIDFDTSEFNGSCDMNKIRKKLFDHHPFAVAFRRRGSAKIKTEEIEIPCSHICYRVHFVLTGKWNEGGDEVTFSTTIDEENCVCDLRSTMKFFKKSPLVSLKLIDDEDVGAIEYTRPITASIGKSYYASASTDGLQGFLGELFVSDFQQQTTECFDTSGAMEQSTIDSFKVAYVVARNFLIEKGLTTEKLDDRKILFSVDNFDYDYPLNGASITVSQSVAIISHVMNRAPIKCLITGQLYATGEIIAVGGVKAKAKAAEVNEMLFLCPDGNKHEIECGSKVITVKNIEEVCLIVFPEM